MKLFCMKFNLIDRGHEDALYLIFLNFLFFLCNFDTSVFYNAYNSEESKKLFMEQKG